MRHASYIGLGGLAMVLGGLIALELKGALMAGGAPAAGLSGSATRPIGNIATASAKPDQTASWVATLLERPLFSPSRAPPAAAVTKSLANGSVLPRLSGIMITPVKKTALFTPDGGPQIIAGEGGRIGDFTVRSIAPETVTLSGPHGVVVLHTAFDRGGGQPDTAPPQPAPIGLFGGISGAFMPSWLNNGKLDLPNAATWSGPPPLSRLPVKPKAPASPSLLAAPGPPG